MNRLLTVNEVGTLLSIHPKTVYSWTKSGRLPCVRVGVLIRFQEREISRLLNERTREVTDPAMLCPQTKITLDLAAFDRLHLGAKGGESAVGKSERRWNYPGIGSVIERKTRKGQSRWYIDFRLKGERRREVLRVETRGEAVEILQAQALAKFSRHPMAANPTQAISDLQFADLADKYLSYAEKTKRSASTDRYRLRPIREAFGTARLSEIGKAMILEFRERRLKAGISRASTNRELMLLSRIFTWTEAEGLWSGNPVKGIKKFSEADTIRNRVLSADEETRLFRELALHVRPVVLIALNAGLRRGEILNLPWKNVDLRKRVLTVEGTKSGKARFVPINSLLADVLGKLKALGQDRVRVFPFKDVTSAFERACQRAKLEDFHFHDLRRTFGTRLLERGADIVTISHLLGHSSVVVTQRYLHPDDRFSREAVDRLIEGTEREALPPEKWSNMVNSPSPRALPSPARTLFSVN
jgi:excisionase family DNA binding protein